MTKHGLVIWTPPFQIENSNVSMLEYYYKEKRTMVDFRRGPLGLHFDGFAAYLKAKGYTTDWGKAVLGKCCQFNSFLIDQGITRCAQLTESHIDRFSKSISPIPDPARGILPSPWDRIHLAGQCREV